MSTALNHNLTNSSASFDQDKFLRDLDVDGYSVVPEVVPPEMLAQLRAELSKAIEAENHKRKDETGYRDFGMVLFCPTYGRSFIDLVEYEPFLTPVELLMGQNCIVYSYTSSSLPPKGGNYATRVHNDCSYPISPNYMTRFGVLIALDDFTEGNGATFVLPGSHKLSEPPTDEHFYDNARRLVMPAGSAWYTNQKVWHAGGVNNTDQWRHAVTVGFCRGYMKQRIDVPRLLTGMAAGLSDRALQKLGFFAQVPVSYEEYYAPFEKRPFRQAID